MSGAGVLLLALAVAGCATSKKAAQPVVEKDVARVIKLGDGTLCVEPAGLAETRQTPGAVQLRELFDAEEKPGEALAKAKELKRKMMEEARNRKPPPEEFQAKMQLLQELMRQAGEDGKDMSAVARLWEEMRPLMEAQKYKEAEEVMDRVRQSMVK